MRSEQRCDRIRLDISARLDDELTVTAAARLDEHLEGCQACRTYEQRIREARRAVRLAAVEDVPDLTEAIIERVAVEGPLERRRARRAAHLRTALIAAAASITLLLGVTSPWLDRPADLAAASDVVRGVRRAAYSIDAYSATISIVERGWHERVPQREFKAFIHFEAPERFRFELRDVTSYPDPAIWPRNDVELVATASRHWIAEPLSCPADALPACATGNRRVRSVVGRSPFDGTTALPTDIIVPVQTLASDDAFTIAGNDVVAGRAAVHVVLDYRSAAALVASLQPGGSWRPFHPLDRVDLWLDAQTWLPLEFTVRTARGPERARWAEAMGLSDSPGSTLFSATAEEFMETESFPAELFKAPTGGSVIDSDFRPAPFDALGDSLAPTYTGGLQPYRAGVSRNATLLSYVRGMEWLKVTTLPAAERPAAGADPAAADEIRLPTGSVVYYRPANETLRREVDIFGFEKHVHLETNLPREQLLRVAASLDVTGRPPPLAEAPGYSVRRIGAAAIDRLEFAVEPTFLPDGYDPRTPSAAVLERSHGVSTLVAYYRQPEAEFGSFGIRLTQRPAERLLPSSERFLPVELGEVRARWSAERSELEWVGDGVYRAIAVPSFELSTAVAIAEGLE